MWNNSFGSSKSRSKSKSQSPNELNRYMKEYSYNCNDNVIGRTDSKQIKSKLNYNNSAESAYIDSVKPVYSNSVEKNLFLHNKN